MSLLQRALQYGVLVTLLAYGLAGPGKFFRHLLVHEDDLVQRIAYLAAHAHLVNRHSYVEIAISDLQQYS